MSFKLLKVAFFWAVACVATAPSPSYADTTIANNITLTADADWRADGVVTVPQGVTVDLNGHTLWVSGLAGAGTFTSSVAEPSTFDLTTADASKVSSTTTFHSEWRAPDGRKAAVLVNWTREEQAYDLAAPDIAAAGVLPARSWRIVVK